MKKLLLSLSILTTGAAFAQNVIIPDANFKAYLTSFSAINTNADNEIQVNEAQAYTGTISCNNQNISDLTGIEAFSNITELYCNDNQLTSLDLSSNTALTLIWCHNNQLTSINLGNNSNLIDFSTYNNQLTALDVSNCNSIDNIQVSDNNLTSLDVSSCTSLTYLWCASNQLSNLNTSNNPLLDELLCSNNQITSLDISSNPLIAQLKCNNNLLSSLNIANGNNHNFTIFNASNNTNLLCIQVDDESANYLPSWKQFNLVDSVVNFSENCQTWSSISKTTEFRTNFYPNPTNSILNIQAKGKVKTVAIYNLIGERVFTSRSETQLNIDGLPAGTYLVEVVTDAGKSVEKLIKE